MKLCVTATAGDLNAEVDPRFGRSQYFVFVDSDTMAFEAIANDAIAASGGAGIQAAQAVVNKGVSVVISGNIGPNAFQVLTTAGVKILTGAYGTVKEAIEMYKTGELNEADTSTVSAHAGMGANAPASGLGRGRGGGPGMQQPVPSQTQSQAAQVPMTPGTKAEKIEELSEMVTGLQRDLEEVKRRIEELKGGEVK